MDILKASVMSGDDDYLGALEKLNLMFESINGGQVLPTKFVDYKAGWYQDRDGNLYQYDGVVWDVVPETASGNLEYLG